jgi:diguanylate cyclase (GGDEF)-like protein
MLDQEGPVARLARRVIVPAAFFAAYVATGVLAFDLASGHPTVGPVWAPTGIALAAFIIAGPRVWPVILLASFFVHWSTAGSWATSALIAVGNTLQGAVAAFLVNRFAGGRDVFRRAPNVFRFATLIAPASATVSASCSLVLLSLTGLESWRADGTLWATWCLGDLTGALAVTPFIVLWATGPWQRTRFQIAESLTLLILFVPTCLAIFAGLLPLHDQHYPLQILCVPFLMWAAFRLGRRESATVVVILTAVAAYGTLSGDGPFVREAQNESFLLLQLYVSVWAVMTMALAAVVSEHAHAERVATAMAITDPLTELANFRRLIEELDVEIARSTRTGQPFALVFVDVNGLKKINDTFGHLTGNQALRRVADVLRRESRSTDTPARFGGDEFVIVLAHTDEAGAQMVARRVAAKVAADRSARPPLSVTTGVAEYPRDGTTAALLLGTADGALYRSRARPLSARRPASGE